MGNKTTKTNQTQVQDQTTHDVVTPDNPAWVDSLVQGVGSNIGGLSNLDPYSLIAGPDPLQTQAAQGAGALTSSPYFGQGAGMITAGATGGPNLATGASSLDNLDKFFSPYKKNVIDASLADFDFGAGKTRAQDSLNIAKSGAFGGSGAAITQSMTNDALTRGRGALSAGLNDQGFGQALSASQADAQLRQQNNQFNAGQGDSAANRLMSGGGALAGIGEAQGADARANTGLQMDVGSILQQLAQQKAGAPVSLLGTQAGLLNSLPLGLFHGQTSDGTAHSTGTTNGTQTVSDPMGALGTAAMTGAALFGAPFTGGTSLGLLGSLGGAAGGLNMLTKGATGLSALKGLY